MRIKRRYKITIEDESRLETLARWSLTPRMIALLTGVAVVGIFIIGFIFVLLTPAKQLIPGYYRPSQRAASEEALLKVDSIRDAYRANDIYMANLLAVLDSERTPTDSVAAGHHNATATQDSLLPTSAEETQFIRAMQEREKFNISILAPMAAEGMLFYPVADTGVVTQDSRDSYSTKIAIAKGTEIMALADGVALAVYGDPFHGGYSIILQHPNGFVSRYSGLGTPLVGQSDMVAGGGIIALAPNTPASKSQYINVEMWHNGNPLVPYRYVK